MKNDEPAFPHLIDSCQRINESEHWPGLSVRAYIAIAAMQGMLSNQGIIDICSEARFRFIAEKSVDCADGLIAELAKEKSNKEGEKNG